MTSTFRQDTSTSSIGPGIREAMVTDAWNTPLGRPNGGYVLALMLRSLMDEFDVGRPASASITYMASPEPGVLARLTTRMIKSGRRVQAAEVQLNQQDRPVGHLVVNFLRDHEGISTELGSAPRLPKPEDCFDPTESQQFPGRLYEQLDQRWVKVPGWVQGKPSGVPVAESWIRLVGGAPIDWPALAMLCDASPPPVLELGPKVSMTVQLTVHLHRLPAEGSWVASRMSTQHVAEGMHEEDGELWDEQGNLLAQSRQLAILL